MNACETAGRACLVVTAAGLGRRHPGKLLVPLEGRPALEHTLDALWVAEFPLVIVIPDPARRPELPRIAELDTLVTRWCERPGREGCRVVHNPEPELGLARSLVLGVLAAGDPEYLGFCNGDRCFVKGASVRACATALEAGPEILLPVDAALPGRPGHPVFFHRRFRPELLALRGDTGARPLLERHPGAITRLELQDPGVWRDLDGWLDETGGSHTP